MLSRIKKIFNFKKEKEISIEDKINNLYDELESDLVQFLIGSDIEAFAEKFNEEISKKREYYASELGFILPEIRITGDDDLQENQYLLKLSGRVVEERFVVPSEDCVIKDLSSSIDGIVENHLEEIFTYKILERYINLVQRNSSWLIWNLTNVVKLSDIRLVLINILKEKKSIKNISYIMEKIYENVLDYGYCKEINIKFLTKQVIEAL